jgi:NADH dehydrogenase
MFLQLTVFKVFLQAAYARITIMRKKHILIVGGGFAGVKAALELSGNEHFDVTLLSNRNYFQYYASLYHTATGGRAAQSQISFENLFEGHGLSVIIGEAQTLDRRAHKLTLVSGEVLTYDTIILALGVITNYFGITGLDEFSFGTKSIDEAEKLKAHLHQQLIDERKPDLNYVVVGGGPTGIELAGAMTEYLRQIMKNHQINGRAVHIDLVEAAPRLLPRSPRSMSRAVALHLRHLGIKLYLGQTVQGETADALSVNGRALTSHSVVWTAGMATHPFFKNNGFGFGQHGKVAVNVYLQADDDVYVAGDDANTPYSGMAQTALYDGEYIARNLIRQADGKKLKPYKPKQPITVIPAGPHWAAVQWGPLKLYGRLGWWLRELADLVAFHDYEPGRSASKQFMTEFGVEESCPECQLHGNLYQ